MAWACVFGEIYETSISQIWPRGQLDETLCSTSPHRLVHLLASVSSPAVTVDEFSVLL